MQRNPTPLWHATAREQVTGYERIRDLLEGWSADAGEETDDHDRLVLILERGRLAAGDQGSRLDRLRAAAEAAGVEIAVWPTPRYRRFARDPSDLGAIAVRAPPLLRTLGGFIRWYRARRCAPVAVFLDRVANPYNIGGVLRTAECAGAALVCIDEPTHSGLSHADRRTIERVAMSAAAFLPLIAVDPADALERLGEVGYQRVGIETDGDAVYSSVALTAPVALVFGGEAVGLSGPVRERCDRCVRVPMRGLIPSINIGHTVAAVLFEVLRQMGHGHDW